MTKQINSTHNGTKHLIKFDVIFCCGQICNFFKLNPKKVWVNRRVFSYAIYTKEGFDGLIEIYNEGTVKTYYNLSLDNRLQQIKMVCGNMNFCDGFWYAHKKAIEHDLYFSYKNIL